MIGKLQKWLSGKDAGSADRPRLGSNEWTSAVYAVGDIHGCLAEFEALDQQIARDGAAFPGGKWIVHLGDYVDRGPNSAGVIEKLMAGAPSGFVRLCLAGNHEAMMLDYIDNPLSDSPWLEFGGMDTLASYGIKPAQIRSHSVRDRKAILHDHIPERHLNWLRALPSLLWLPGTVFVHAGLRPGIPPENQLEQDLLWIREPFLSFAGQPGLRVVHGHTPMAQPVVSPHRICVDTGVFTTGILTAVRLLPGGEAKILSAMAATR